jgi:hypothetical protein
VDVDIKVKELRPLLDSVKAALECLEGNDCEADPRVVALKARYSEYLGGCHRAVVVKLETAAQEQA